MTLFVNETEIKQETIDAEFDRLKPEYEQYAQHNEVDADLDRLQKWAKENLIERALLQQEAAARSKKSADLSTTNEETTGDAHRQEHIQALVNDITSKAPEPSDAEIAAFYNDHKDLFIRPDQVHAAHIVKHSPQGYSEPNAYTSALNIREQIRQGTSFEELAAQQSDCPERAGDLGVFGRGQMVEAFDDVVFNLQPGEVSDVFQTPFGYHIAKVYEKHDAEQASLEKARSHIIEHLHKNAKGEALNAFVDNLKEKAVIREE